MGQKTNSIIFRKNLNYLNYESIYNEKNFEELALYVFIDNEIKNYLNRVFFLYGLILTNCKIEYFDSNINIFVSYYTTENCYYRIIKKSFSTNKCKAKIRRKYHKKNKTVTNIKKSGQTLIKKNFFLCSSKFQNEKQIKEIKKIITSYLSSKKLVKKTLKNNNKKKIILKLNNAKNNQKHIKYIRKKTSLPLKRPLKRLKPLRLLKKYFLNNKNDDSAKLKKLDFASNLLKSISDYTKNHFNVSVTFQKLNKGVSLRMKNYEVISFKKSVLALQRDSKNNYFKETINILMIILTKKNSAKLLSDYLAYQLKKQKKQKWFLNFFRLALLKLINNSQISRIKGIKIMLNGRINRSMRSRHIIIDYGRSPIQSFDCKIDFFQSVSYTISGTIGIKVWISELVKQTKLEKNKIGFLKSCKGNFLSSNKDL